MRTWLLSWNRAIQIYKILQSPVSWDVKALMSNPMEQHVRMTASKSCIHGMRVAA